MVGEYQRHFQDQEDKVEVEAYALWRRFRRIGLPQDVLSIELTHGFLPVGPDEDKPEPSPALVYEPIFRNFTNPEIATIQLGRLVSLKERGLSDDQNFYYGRLRDYFFGASLAFDYYDALSANNEYDHTEIKYVAEEFGNFTYTLDMIATVDGLWDITQNQKRTEKVDRKHVEQASKPSSIDIPEPQGPKTFDDIHEYVESTIKKIDDILLSKM